MPRKPATIISDATRASLSTPAGDWQDVPCHHRYYGARPSMAASASSRPAAARASAAAGQLFGF